MQTPSISLLLLTIHAVYGQLNYEGNPLTEDNVYTAEESHFAEKTAKARALEKPDTEDSYLLAAKTLKAQRSQNLYPSHDDRAKNGAYLTSRNEISSAGSLSANTYRTIPSETVQKNPAPTNDAVFSTQINEAQNYEGTESQNQVYPVSAEPLQPQAYDPTESALAMFLNSQTPQESRMALDKYLGAGQKEAQTVDASPSPYQPHISDIVLPQQQLINGGQQMSGGQDVRYSQYANEEYPSSQLIESFVANQQAGRNINQLNRPAEVLGRKNPVLIRVPSSSYGRRSFVVRPPYKGPLYRAQSRVGPLIGHRKGQHGFHSPGRDGLEVIYTKPPGHGHSQYLRGQNPQQDAAAWFPDADHPPPDMNVYYSQLYAQSYDPHYYNYIAKYGKIKPYLYGKFNKKKEGFLSELFQSFKKHGMKHVMNPMFLMGLGIPMITLMLSALANHAMARSISGVNGDIHITDEDINEWTTKLRKALECYTETTSESDRTKCAVWD